MAAERPEARAFPTARPFLLFAVFVAVALTALASFTVIVAGGEFPGMAFDLALAVGAFTASQLARIRVRMGGVVILLAWGEVGVIAVLCLVPAPWAPIAIFVGAVVGHAYLLIGADAPRRARIVVGIFAVSVGGVVATAVVAALVDTTVAVRVDVQRPATFLPVLLASATYFLVASLLVSWWISGVMGLDLGTVWRRAARSKRPMLVGNVAVGLAVAVVISVDVVWLVALVPVLWLLHLTYLRQMRAAMQQRTWEALADATRRLNRLDERGVVAAALRGAAELFAPSEVEVTLELTLGRRRRYFAHTRDITDLALEPDGVIADRADNAVRADNTARADNAVVGPDATGAAPDDERHVHTRRLLVGDTYLGEIRLFFRRTRPTWPSGRVADLGASEEHAFSTFADALASALQDAATHRRLQAMTARSAYAAVHDVLTGLCNRSTLLARGNAQLLRFDAETVAGGDGPQTLVALVLLDIDGLRAVNDALSYAAGDEVLRVLARRLAANQRAGEIVARLGGDEFAILLVEPAVVGTARDWSYPVDRARQFLTLLAEPAEVANVTIAVEASAGVVVEAAGGCDMAELLRRADVALRQAKRRAARVVRYEAANDGASTGRLALLAELRDALATTDQLLLYLQPTVDLVTGGATGAEALLRWRHPRRGLLEPGEFLGAVEHSELAGGLTLHVVDLALRVAAGWQEQGLRRPISVNLCARCLLDPTLPAAVAELLTTHGVAPHRLIVEITEAVMGAELAVVDSVIQGLRDIGVGVSVDNFGTESASLEFLTRFAVDEVKIDRAFVAAMADSPEVAAIVRATVDLARELGLRVVAEGVERPDQRAALVDLGVTSAQGFLFHRPLGVAEATTVLLGQ